MTLEYNCSGADRKNLVHAISEITELNAQYKGAPSFNFEVGPFTIDKNGTVSFDENALGGIDLDLMMERLEALGYECPGFDDATCTAIGVPAELFTEAQFENLQGIMKAKGTLIKKALGADSVFILKDEEEQVVSLNICPSVADPDEIDAFSRLFTALCDMARNQKRVTAKEKEVDNEKYAFRCFLLRLGFIGDEYKGVRKILLRNLSGSSAFKSGAKAEAQAASENTEAETTVEEVSENVAEYQA